MSFILDTLEQMLSLNEGEKATVNAALPYAAKWVTMLNAQWNTLEDGVNWIGSGKPIWIRLIEDGKKLGPVAQDVLSGSDNVFEAAGAMAEVNDAKAVIAANPKMMNALTSDYKKLAPLIAQIEGDMKKPEVAAAATLIYNKMNVQVVTAHQLIGGILASYISGR